MCKSLLESLLCTYAITAFFLVIMKTYLYNFDPLKPHFYIVKLGFTEVYIILRRGGSNEYPQSMF